MFQALTALQLTISEGENATVMIPLTFLLLTGVMWLYFLTLRALRRVGFEMETIAFFLSTLSLAVTSSSNTPALFKQFLCVVLGLALFLVLGVFLRNLDRAKKIRWLMAAGAIGLLSLTVVLYLAGPHRHQIWSGQLAEPLQALGAALGAGQNLLHLCRGSHPGPALPQAEPWACSSCSPACAWPVWPI